MIEKVHDIARSGSIVVLTIHQPSHRILLLLDHLIILARGQLMFQGAPKDVTFHLGRMRRKVPKGENPIEYLLDVIQEYDQSEFGVAALADFALTGMKPPPLAEESISISTIPPSPTPPYPSRSWADGPIDKGKPRGRLHLETDLSRVDDFDRSLRSPGFSLRSWSSSNTAIVRKVRFNPSHHEIDRKAQPPLR